MLSQKGTLMLCSFFVQQQQQQRQPKWWPFRSKTAGVAEREAMDDEVKEYVQYCIVSGEAGAATF